MKKYQIAVLAGMLVSTAVAAQARADGFICGTDDRELTIQVYDHTDASQGTRTASVMVLSDPTAEDGNQTIARFTQVDETLNNQGPTYFARVTPAVSRDPAREYISATPLNELNQISVNVDFNYSNPVPDGTIVPGMMNLEMLNGAHFRKELTCVRYLKQG